MTDLESHVPLLRPPRKSHRHTSRLLDRECGVHRQSTGTYKIHRTGGDWWNLYIHAPFHTILNTKTSRIISGVFALYGLTIALFALVYWIIGHDCHLGISSLVEAWMFSLETMMTIGFGAPGDDVFFDHCASMAWLLTLESFAGIFLDSICIGLFFARFSRAQSRASTIIFSQDAVIRELQGEFYFMFRVCERRKHQLVEAHVRCYAVRHEERSSKKKTRAAYYQSQAMRLNQPDDDTGSMLLMALPQMIIHRIDPWSPFYPPSFRVESDRDCSSSYGYPEPPQREIDIENGNRERKSGVPVTPKLTQEDIAAYIRRTEMEIIVILEGIDSPTSASMQARHSYCEEDMAWHHEFVPCVDFHPETGGAVIDFDLFHELTHETSETTRERKDVLDFV